MSNVPFTLTLVEAVLLAWSVCATVFWRDAVKQRDSIGETMVGLAGAVADGDITFKRNRDGMPTPIELRK